MATGTNTARPARTRRSTAAATKATPAKAAPKPVEAEAPEEVTEVEAYVVNLEEHADGPTKSYARFVPPKNSGCVGTFYAPLGTVSVRVRIEGPATK